MCTLVYRAIITAKNIQLKSKLIYFQIVSRQDAFPALLSFNKQAKYTYQRS